MRVTTSGTEKEREIQGGIEIAATGWTLLVSILKVSDTILSLHSPDDLGVILR